jgi:hypothetical protein
VHAVRYLGELTRCKSWLIETCTKRDARQSGFGVGPTLRAAPHVSLYNSPADHSRSARKAELVCPK